MRKSVCLQVGHWGIENIDTPEQNKHLRAWRSTSVLKRSTGASGERDYHWDQVMPLLRDKLIAAGVQVYLVNAIWNEVTYNRREYDLWVSLHYDGGGSENRCMISSPLINKKPKYLSESAHRKAVEFARIWKETYPQLTGTINRDNRITAGMLEYYAFDYVGYDTPAVIIEHFNHTSERGTFLKENPELVAEADFKAIIKFLGISAPQPQPQPEPTPTPTPDPVPSVVSDDNARINIDGRFGVMKLSVIRDLMTKWDQVLSQDSTAAEDVKIIRMTLNSLFTLGKITDKNITDLLSRKPEDCSQYTFKLDQISQIAFGKGWTWVRINQIKALLKGVQ